MGYNSGAILKISIAALAVSILFTFVLRGSWEPKTEGIQYDRIGWNVASGHGFSLSDSEPYVPTMLRDPAYPFFLGIIYRLFGHNTVAVVSFQVILFVFTCLIAYAMALAVFGEKNAFFSGMICAISPAMANYPSYIISETLFTFLISVTVFCLIKAVCTQKIAWYSLAGIVLAAAALCKSLMIPFFLIAVVSIVILRGPGLKILSGKIVARIIIFSFFFLLLAGSWSLRNHAMFGTYQISLKGGVALWERAERLAKPWKDMGYEVLFDFSEYLGSKIFPGAAENPRDVLLEWSRKGHSKDVELTRMGLTPLEIDRTLRKEAIGKIRANPVKFAAYIPMELVKMTAFIYVPMLNEPHIIARFHGMRYGDVILSSIRGVFRLSAYPVLILAIIGIVAERRSWRKWYFFLAIIVYINLVYSMLFSMGRYAVPLSPFYFIFAVAGLAALYGRHEKT